MVRRMAVVLAAVFCLWDLGLQTRALGNGWIRVSLLEDAGVTSVMLWRVADSKGEGYALTEVFGGGMIRSEDIQTPELAQWLTEAAAAKGQKRMLDADGCADFSNLQSGLYLIAPEEQSPDTFPSILVPLPLHGSWEVLARPQTRELLTESPPTGEHLSPVFAAMGLILSGMGLAACAQKLRKK